MRRPNAVDTSENASVSFARHGGWTGAERRQSERRPIDAAAGEMTQVRHVESVAARTTVRSKDHPISRTKITPAPYREATLARERLVEALRENVHRRLAYVIAKAGYGKTTLLSDFSHRGFVRCLWYKLDPSDRDWVTFISYLVAAGREARGDFGAGTAALLGQ